MGVEEKQCSRNFIRRIKSNYLLVRYRSGIMRKGSYKVNLMNVLRDVALIKMK